MAGMSDDKSPHSILEPSPGMTIRGTIRHIYPDSLLIDLGNGFEGRISRLHASLLSGAPDLASRFVVGDAIDVVVLKTCRTKEGRLDIRARHAEASSEPDVRTMPGEGDQISGTVREFLEDNVLIELNNGLIARLHRSNVTWFDRKPDVSLIFAVGDRIDVVVTKVHRRSSGPTRIEVSHREMRPVQPSDLATRFPPGLVLPGRVAEHLPFGVFLRFDSEFIGLLHDSEVSWMDGEARASTRFPIGQVVSVIIEGINEKKRRFYVSYRQANEAPFTEGLLPGLRLSGAVLKINQYALIIQLTPRSFGILRTADMPAEARGLYDVGDRVHVVVKEQFDEVSQVRLLLDVAKLGDEWQRLTQQPPPTGATDSSARRTFFEGTKRAITINYYERNPKARTACLNYYGYACVICGFSFHERYGEVGEGFIHVHHTKPLGEAEGAYELDPIQDLCPVCPNCHAIVHRRIPAFSIDEVRAFLKK